MPFYSQIKRDRLEVARVDSLQGLRIVIGRHEYRVDIWRARLPGSTTPVYLVESDALYARPTLYTSDPDEHRRFLVLTRAALECCRRMNFRPHIVHSHDWHTAFAPLWLRSIYKNDPVFAGTKSVMTIHNIGYQGAFARRDVADLDLGADAYLLHQDDLKAGHINALKHGILHADAVTTVSPTYAREITTPHYGMGMEQALAARGSAVHGILNGVDYEEWDPRNDKHLPIHFGPGESIAQGRAQAQFPAAPGHEADAGTRAAVRHREPARLAEGLRPAHRHAAETAAGRTTCGSRWSARASRSTRSSSPASRETYRGRAWFFGGYDEASRTGSKAPATCS